MLAAFFEKNCLKQNPYKINYAFDSITIYNSAHQKFAAIFLLVR